MTEIKRATTFHIKLADVVIRIEPMFDYMKEYCQEYIIEEQESYDSQPKAELLHSFVVRTENADIMFERERSKAEAEREGHSPVEYTDAYLETLAVYRQIAERMTMFDTLLFHGSVIAVDGTGYLFTAKSGTGKSTHTRLWRAQFGDRAVMVNDDKPLLKITEEGVMVYGTPWDGKHRLNTNISVPLKAVCVLTRDTVNHIEEISPKEAYGMLLQQTYRPMDKVSMMQTLKLMDEMMKKTRFYRLGCNMDPEAAKVAFEGMNGGLA